ncbi:MAG: hypothetical protein WAM09_18285, partial [Anaerolineales bacterium]
MQIASQPPVIRGGRAVLSTLPAQCIQTNRRPITPAVLFSQKERNMTQTNSSILRDYFDEVINQKQLDLI